MRAAWVLHDRSDLTAFLYDGETGQQRPQRAAITTVLLRVFPWVK